MGKSQLVETLMGAIVLAVAGFFLVFAYTSTNIRTIRGYEVLAKFERADGINAGTDVKISGIKVGTVVEQRLDPDTFLAVLKLSIDNRIKLPVDTVAQVSSEGLLGANFLQLVPGADDKTIPHGGEIKYTQAPVNLVQLLGKFVFGAAEKAQQSQGQGQDQNSPQPAK
jgi:phospholipid/cholesterol/gamma-HCH transport system substrate-binding protein